MTKKKFSDLTIDEANIMFSNNQKNLEAAVETTLYKVLGNLGVDTDDRQKCQEDFAFLRRQREGSEQTLSYIKKGSISIVIAALAWSIWMGFKQYLVK